MFAVRTDQIQYMQRPVIVANFAFALILHVLLLQLMFNINK